LCSGYYTEEIDYTRIFHELFESDPNFDNFKQAHENLPDKYYTLTMIYKITKGGLINLMKIKGGGIVNKKNQITIN